MKKILMILVLSLLLNGNASALMVACKNFYEGNLITNETFDLSNGSKWKPEYTSTHIYWRQFKITNNAEKKGTVFYFELDRYSGFLRTRVTEENFLRVLLKGNRVNMGAPTEFILDGECNRKKKKKF
tara:strand:+ start:465 stop:845 length:381 start_codon:yes stop_codon:yes gene_type:complete